MKKFGLKIWILIFAIIFSFLSIFSLPPTFMEKGVMITSVDQNSTVFELGLRQGQIINSIDGDKVTSLEDFSDIMKDKFVSGENVRMTIGTKKSEIVILTKEAPEITVSKIPATNLKMGLDLSGGARALIKAKDKQLSSEEIADLVDITSNRLNEFGLTDLKVSPVSDLAGNHFMLIEIAGATPKDLEEMISKQGKFEAKVGNETAFVGGDRDIASVCRNDATCAGIHQCQQGEGGYFCNFRFTIYLSENAANKHAEITDRLEINATNPEYLSEKLNLFLDDKLVDSLFIGEGLKGRVTTQIAISGSGAGATRDEAYEVATENMHKLQTILITGSLPYQLEIVKLDTISPVLGGDFIKAILIAGIFALLAVSIIVFLRYKRGKASVALVITSLSEILIILGIASFIKWNLDLPSIAGILATIGTGIDQQIIILDEAKQKTLLSIKEKLKRAFKIVMGSYFTSVVSLLPLMWAGAGLLKGFAITTIIGISVGVLITRPAFSEMIKRIEE